ncbi:hypothetical protein ABK040_001360 [Willaertia magna]
MESWEETSTTNNECNNNSDNQTTTPLSSLQQFCNNYNVNIEEYFTNTKYRYIKILSTIENEIFLEFKNLNIELITILKKYNIYAILKDITINKLNCYKLGKIIGIDISSIYTILIFEGIFPKIKQQLELLKEEEEEISIIDLCCAPGMKSFLIYDIFHSIFNFIIFGIDNSYHRLMTTKNILKKLKIKNFKLILGDSTIYCNENIPKIVNRYKYIEKLKEIPKEGILIYDFCNFDKNLKYLNNTLQQNLNYFTKNKKFNIVIVDAECTTDGRIDYFKNNEKQIQYTLQNMENITTLQKKLILNGFNLLSKNGYLLYCTCSFTIEQNENII